MAARVTQERSLGAILGFAIGDALGMPVVGRTQEEVVSEFGQIDDYHGRLFSDGAELSPGEFTDCTEIALCIMETYTSANGVLDPELIRARMQFLARGESRRWMNAETLRSLDDDNEPWFRSMAIDDPEVAMRGFPIGLIHAAPIVDLEAVRRDAATVVTLTHGDPAVADQATLVATAVARVLAGTSTQATLIGDLRNVCRDPALLSHLDRAIRLPGDGNSAFAPGTGNYAVDALVSAMVTFVHARTFEDAVFEAASAGGLAASRAALAGALAGAHFGAGGIPQSLIDKLEGRIYLTLAAPWFYRTIQLMTGRGIAIEKQIS